METREADSSVNPPEQCPISQPPIRRAWTSTVVTAIKGTCSAIGYIFLFYLFEPYLWPVIRVLYRKILSWKRIFVVSCIAVCVDALFLYIPIINGNKCLGIDKTLRNVLLALRSLIDLIFIIHVILQMLALSIKKIRYRDHSFDTERRFWVDFGEKTQTRWYHKLTIIKEDSKLSWLSVSLVINVLAIIPVPQVAILVFFSRIGGSGFDLKTAFINLFIVFQFVVRVCQIYVLSKKVNTSGKWIQGVFNLFLYILASHVLAAFWYFFAIQREISCWNKACRKSAGCVATYDCSGTSSMSDTFLNGKCPIYSPNTTVFDFGIYLDILQSGNTGSVNFSTKFLYSLWWGLKNLSNFGTNLEPSGYLWENCFAIVICVVGLLLFLFLIGNVQMSAAKSVNSNDLRRMKIKANYKELNMLIYRYARPDSETAGIVKEMRDKMPPPEDYIDKVVDLDLLFTDLMLFADEAIRRQVMNMIGMRAIIGSGAWGLKEVLSFEELEPICNYLSHRTYHEDDWIVQAGQPLHEMLIVLDGVIELTDSTSIISNAAGSSRNSSKNLLKMYDCLGGELLNWASFNLHRKSYFSPVPTLTQDAKCQTKVTVLLLDRSKLLNSVFPDHLSKLHRINIAQQLEESAVNQIMNQQYPIPMAQWRRPYRGWLKVNCSAVWDGESKPAGVGWVCRNDEGAFVGAASLGGNICIDRFLAEAFSVAKAIEFCLMRINVERIVVESDNKDLMDCLLWLKHVDVVEPSDVYYCQDNEQNRRTVYRQELDPNDRIGECLRPILWEIYFKLAPNLKAITYVHCETHCNAAAYWVAGHAIHAPGYWYTLGPNSAPSWLIPALIKDSPNCTFEEGQSSTSINV